MPAPLATLLIVTVLLAPPSPEARVSLDVKDASVVDIVSVLAVVYDARTNTLIIVD